MENPKRSSPEICGETGFNKTHIYSKIFIYISQFYPLFHVSKQKLRPYYHGWIFNKVSIWREVINNHILLLDQVLSMFKVYIRGSRANLSWIVN